MTTPHAVEDITRDEGGIVLHAYPDPITKGEPWTCGVGCTGPDIGPDTVWSEGTAIARRDQKVSEAVHDLDRNVPWWRSLCDARQDVFLNMVFNMGWPRFSGFHQMLEAANTHNYDKAADEMLASLWALQVKDRARRLAEQMRTGIRA